MPGSILGNIVRRVEDPELLVGAGRYVGDIPIEGVLNAAFVRCPFPHALIKSVDSTCASAMPGVVAVLDSADVGLGSLPGFMPPMHPSIERFALASGRARFAGEAVALVVAATVAQALDAVDAVEVDYEPLSGVADVEKAVAESAPLQFPEMGTNVAGGMRDHRGADPFEEADVVVRARFENQRVAVAPMEGNSIAAIPIEGEGSVRLRVYVATQMPHRFRDGLCQIFDLKPDEVHVITPNVGGAFGGKVGLVSEFAAIVAAALRLGRPVRWFETRSENLAGMDGRGQVQYPELGLKNDGRIVGLRVRAIGDSGAYAGFGGTLVVGPTRNMSQGVYEIPTIDFDAAVVMTNTSPMGTFRGAGRPEAASMLERLMDIAAAELGMDPAEIRRRNFIGPDVFPYTTRTGMVYDVGDYGRALEEVLRIADYDSLRAEQAERRARGDKMLLGIGISAYVEITAGGAGGEFGSVEIHPDGAATIRVGTAASGQGHATAFSMLVADRLGIDMDRIRFIQADTFEVPTGGGTGGSRSLQLGGSSVDEAARGVYDKGIELAAELLEADPADVTVDSDGRVGVAGVPATALTWAELAQAAEDRGSRLVAEGNFIAPGPTYPFGAHVSVVEVDSETGKVRPLRHIAVDDAGTVISPLLVQGQQHGGIAQGMSQALWEEMRYDDDANPLTGNFATYCIPSAAETCSYEAHSIETPTPYNPLGAKGIGESATVGSTPAVQNAVIDALSHLGVRHIDMPLTPERVWSAIEAAKSGSDGVCWREPPDIFSGLTQRPAPTAEDANAETV